MTTLVAYDILPDEVPQGPIENLMYFELLAFTN
jgi:hypothetical protein